MNRRVSGLRLVAVVLFGALSAAPTPGDIGGCSSEVTALDVEAFVRDKRAVDCEQCRQCGITTMRCARACDAVSLPDTSIPASCQPVAHDGVACIRALRAASCDAYVAYVADEASTTPSECAFCRSRESSTYSPGFVVDASVPPDGGR